MIQGIRYNGEVIKFATHSLPKIEVIKNQGATGEEAESRIKLHCYNLSPEKRYMIKCYISGKGSGTRSSGWHHPLNKLPDKDQWYRTQPIWENGQVIGTTKVSTDDERIWSGHIAGTRNLLYGFSGEGSIDEEKLPTIATWGRNGILQTEWILEDSADEYYFTLNYPIWLLDLCKDNGNLLGTHASRYNSRFFRFTVCELNSDNSVSFESDLSNTLVVSGECTIDVDNKKVYARRIQIF